MGRGGGGGLEETCNPSGKIPIGNLAGSRGGVGLPGGLFFRGGG